ncbi:MAG: glycine hydroxymethyltransferase [SAR202 cluster bacterium]|nr:glycine hydroxymethyltransferase [SAR202 cluster bacterium]
MTDTSPLASYLSRAAASGDSPDAGFIAYLASLQQIATVSPDVARSIVAELADQRGNLKMIASENFSSLAVQLAQANLLTDKYAEGYPFHRFYAGCDNVDAVESLAASLAVEIFGADHAYMQPHSGADANLVAYWAILSARVQVPFMEKLEQTDPSALSDDEWAELRSVLGNQRLLGMNYYSGGHLTHGYRHNVSSRMFDAYSYDVDRETGLLDYDDIRARAQEIKPFILLAGYSAYPRHINFRKMREIADEVGAVFMVDMAHFSGLVAGGVFTGDNNPVAYADVVTSTTHKTLRGPRGGFIMCREEFAEHVDKGCPMVLGGPLPHVIAAKAVAFQEIATDQYKAYANRIVENASALACALIKEGVSVLTGGTDNHLMLVNVTPFGLTGRQAESAMRDATITLNRNSLPFDANGPWYTSGLRIGTPALTTLGMGPDEMVEIASIVKTVLANTSASKITKGRNSGTLSKARYRTDEAALQQAQKQVSELLVKFPVYPEIDLEFLQQSFG